MNNIIKLEPGTAVAKPSADAETAAEITACQDRMALSQDALAELQRQPDALSHSFKEFQRSLDRVNLEPLHRDSFRLAKTMDELLADQSAKDL